MRTLQSELIEKGFYKNQGKKKTTNDKPRKHKEKLSKREIEELMGARRPRYKRNRGAFRQI
ncbi:hypothetical protein [Ureibacillus sp. FSL K6-2830]|jgi:hypothetical protein|uniref:hypothetical protein n=1 Tax=Ureibacillus sp. FSL K6-2830 TaxID=2954610 RepID=UPI0030FA64D8